MAAPAVPGNDALAEPLAPTAREACCAAEVSTAARLGAFVFRNRGWLPVLFVAVPLLAPGRPSALGWVIGALLVALGEAVRFAGVAAAGSCTRRRSREVQRLVTYGAFAWCRNPLYAGNFLAWMGFGTISGVYWFLPVAAVLFAVEYQLIVRYEEGVLESIFGDEYLSYKRNTPRWLPRPPRDPSASRGPHAWRAALRSERATLLQYAGLALAFVIKQRVL